MSSDGPNCDSWIFVVDTNMYSGNFERCLCAYMTGVIGDCGVGDDVQGIVRGDFDEKTRATLDDLVMQVTDDHGCYRPVSIWPTPGWWNDGNGKHYRVGEGPVNVRRQWPAYQSVAIFLRKKPSTGIINLLKARASAYLKDPRMTGMETPYKGDSVAEFKKAVLHPAWTPPKNLEILGFRLIHRIIKDDEVPV